MAIFKASIKSYKDAEAFLGGKDERKIGHNTWVRRGNDINGVGLIEVVYHKTPVVGYLSHGSIVLNTGGWLTVTTKDRINQLSPIPVFNVKGEWFVTVLHEGGGRCITPYRDGIAFIMEFGVPTLA